MSSQHTHKPEDLIGKIFYAKSKNTNEAFPVFLFLDILSIDKECTIFNTYNFEYKEISKARYENKVLPDLYKALNAETFQDVNCVPMYQWIII